MRDPQRSAEVRIDACAEGDPAVLRMVRLQGGRGMAAPHPELASPLTRWRAEKT
jgi:hypothetical protein